MGIFLLVLGVAVQAAELRPLQPLIDSAEEGGLLELEPGVYAGPVIIDKPLTIDGRGEVVIDAGGKGTVILLDTDGATLRGLTLRNSGSSHNDIDSGVQVRGNFNVIKDNVIEDCLFGIDLQQSSNNIVRRNRISSKAVDLGIRGDAVRLWYSFENKVTDNIIRNARDTVVWYSANNLIARNDARNGRYSLHFMYSRYNRVEGNHYENNSVGIFLMYSDGVEVIDNYIANAQGPTGVGIGFKETSDVTIEGNKILSCATGLYIDVSPYQPDTTNRIRNNLIAYNAIAIRWLNDWTGNTFSGNHFKGNITEMVVEGGNTANRNHWDGNRWDDYEGFDRDGDGVGDTPHEIYAYADRIWMDVPPAQFFKGSPMLETLDFLERLAPFSPPTLMARDSMPMMESGIGAALTVSGGRPEADERPGAESEQNESEPAAEGFDAYEALRRSLNSEE